MNRCQQNNLFVKIHLMGLYTVIELHHHYQCMTFLSITSLFSTCNFGFLILCVRYIEQERSPRDRGYFDSSRSDYECSRRERSYDSSMESRLVLDILTIETYLFKFSLCIIIMTASSKWMFLGARLSNKDLI